MYVSQTNANIKEASRYGVLANYERINRTYLPHHSETDFSRNPM